MGVFDFPSSSARWVHGRLRYTPLAPEPRWKRFAYASVPVVLVASFVAKAWQQPTALAALVAFIVVALIGGRLLRGRRPDRPTGPLEVSDALVARVRRLLESGRVGDAMLAVETDLSVTLVDAKLITDAVQRRIDHERVQAREGR